MGKRNPWTRLSHVSSNCAWPMFIMARGERACFCQASKLVLMSSMMLESVSAWRSCSCSWRIAPSHRLWDSGWGHCSMCEVSSWGHLHCGQSANRHCLWYTILLPVVTNLVVHLCMLIIWLLSTVSIVIQSMCWMSMFQNHFFLANMFWPPALLCVLAVGIWGLCSISWFPGKYAKILLQNKLMCIGSVFAVKSSVLWLLCPCPHSIVWWWLVDDPYHLGVPFCDGCLGCLNYVKVLGQGIASLWFEASMKGALPIACNLDWPATKIVEQGHFCNCGGNAI